MEPLLIRVTGRRTAARPAVWRQVLWLLLWTSVAASAQDLDLVLEVPARQTVERAAQQVADVVTRAVPDQVHTILYVEPVRTDTERMTKLGARVRGMLQIILLRHYRNARLLADPTSGAAPGSAVRVAVELQPYDHQVLALVKIIDRDGLLVDAELIEMPRSTAISALLQPDTWVAAVIPLEAEAPPDASTAPAAETPPEAEVQLATDTPSEVDEPQLALAVPSPADTPSEPTQPLPATPPSTEPPAPPVEEDVTPAPVEPVKQPAAPQTFEQPAPAPAAEAPEPEAADDPYEPDDVAGFEIPLPLEDDVRFERTLAANDRDRFELSLPAPTTVTVAIEADVETLIALYHAGSAVPFGLHDTGFTGEMEAGVYVIEILAADATASGAYALTVRTSEILPAEAAEADAEEAGGAEALARPTELQPGESQERLMRHTPEWLQLSATPGFYSVTVDSDSEELGAGLHRTRDEPPFLSLIPSGAGLVGALFIGADIPLLQLSAPQADLEVRYAVTFEPIAPPPRAFADQAWADQATLASLQYHQLRVFRRDVYQISLEATSPASAEVAVYLVPAMSSMPPQEPDVSRYELHAGDYLVLVRPIEDGTVGRVCWHLAQGSQPCS